MCPCHGKLVGRVDHKADRSEGVLRARGVFTEDGTDHGYVVAELSAEMDRRSCVSQQP